ncbi:hypothetical protein [Stappia sp. TSB10GB4]|uniref:hypothetical protein n=1 Tax=Stappia sp. TSB10GB4 TaxID=2003584 RepID=UPI0016445302|nr:hypothetical protein [Stappia sp. TSB10GB4]
MSGKEVHSKSRQIIRIQDSTPFDLKLSGLSVIDSRGEDFSSEDFEYAYNSFIFENFVYDDGKYFFIIEFRVGGLIGVKPYFSISADYIYIVNSPEYKREEAKELAEHYARLFVWPRFLTVFDVLAGQVDFSFPKLPQALDHIVWREGGNIRIIE